MPSSLPGAAAIMNQARALRGAIERGLAFAAREPPSARRIAIWILAASSLFWLFFFDGVEFGARAFRAANTGYEQIAQSLAHAGTYSAHGRPTAFRPPLYPLFLAAHIWLFGDAWPIVARISQALISFGCGYLLSVLAERITGTAAVRPLAAAIYAGFVPLQIEAAAKRETIAFVLLSLGCVALISAARRNSWRMAVLGVLIGAAFLTRPTGLLLGVVAIGVFPARPRSRCPKSWERRPTSRWWVRSTSDWSRRC